MKLRIIVLLLLTIATSACRNSRVFPEQAGIDKEAAANRIFHKVALQLKQKTGLCPIGTMGQMHYDVEKLGLSFYYYKPIDIVEGRKLLIQGVNAMLEEVNQEKRIHPYLCRYPFLPRNIRIEIFLRNPDGRDVPQGNLWIMQAEDGYLEYKIDNPITSRLVTIYKETFDEALARIADPTLPLAHFEPVPETSQEELARLRKGISLVSDDGSIWHLDDKGAWTKNPQRSQ